MIHIWGQSALQAGLIIAFIQMIMPVMKRHIPYPVIWRGQQFAALFGFFLLSMAFSLLVFIHVMSGDPFFGAPGNTTRHGGLSLFYCVASVWGDHGGSMLMWNWILGLYGTIMAYKKNHDLELGSWILAVHGFVLFLMSVYLLATTSPFASEALDLLDGNHLNPLLEDPVLAFHPPVLYLGYGGYVIPFCYMVAATFSGKSASGSWIKPVRTWSLWAWSFLTAGIGLGSFWAWYEPGWGGWWFWDPVENASLLPWLAGVALIHTSLVFERSGHLQRTTLILSALCLVLVMAGILLVRSGILSTVHAFAYDSRRGTFLLVIEALIIAIAVAGFLKTSQSPNRPLLSGSFGVPFFTWIGTWVFVTMIIILLAGILYPLSRHLTGQPPVTVSAVYFEKTFVPMGFLAVWLGAIAPLLRWAKTSFHSVSRKAGPGFSILLAGILIILLISRENTERIPGLLGLISGVWMTGMIFYGRWRTHGFSMKVLLSPMVIAHTGMGVMVMGMSISNLLGEEKTVALRIHEEASMGVYKVRLNGVDHIDTGNYIAERILLEVRQGNSGKVSIIRPEKRFYPDWETLITKTALLPDFFSIFYVAPGGILSDDRRVLRLSVHPGVIWIWIGAFLMALGGLMAWKRK